MHPGPPDQIVDERHFISHLTEGCHRLAQHLSASSVGFKLPEGLEPGTEAVLEGLHVLPKVGLLAVMLDEGRLVVKEVDVASRATHEHLHHPLGLGGMVGAPLQNARGAGSECALLAQHGGQCNAAKTTTRLPEKLASCGNVHLIDKAEFTEIEENPTHRRQSVLPSKGLEQFVLFGGWLT